VQRVVQSDEVGKVIGCMTWGSCSIQPGTPDLFFYGVHGVEPLFAIMGPGCQTVARVHTEGADVVTGIWQDGRVGTYRGIRQGNASFGVVVFGSQAIVNVARLSSGYAPLVEQIATFFESGQAPVRAAATIEIFAFMEAADESKRRDGLPVSMAEVMAKARQQALQKIAALDESPASR